MEAVIWRIDRDWNIGFQEDSLVWLLAGFFSSSSAVGQGPWFLTTWVHRIAHDMAANFLQSKQYIREIEAEDSMTFMI